MEMRVNESMVLTVDADTRLRAVERAMELWRSFGLPENVRVFEIHNPYVEGGRWRVGLCPDVEGL